MNRLTRRDAIFGAAKALAGAAVGLLAAVKNPNVVWPATGSIGPLKGYCLAPDPSPVTQNPTVLIRNMYANRTPLLARLGWQPSESSRETFHYPVATGDKNPDGSLSVVPEPNVAFNKTMQLQNLVDDVECTFYYGFGAVVPGHRTRNMGLSNLIITNRVMCPANYFSYQAADFVRDTVQRCREHGGIPDVILFSTNFWSAFVLWGYPLRRKSMGETVFGVPISGYESDILPDVTFIEAVLLHPGTAITLTSSEVILSQSDAPHWSDELIPENDETVQGWKMSIGIELQNERHHAMVSGIEAFAP